MIIPEIWKRILTEANQHRANAAAIAGGAVRDWLWDTTPKDIDVFVYNPDFADPMISPRGGEAVNTNERNEEYVGTQIEAITDFIVDGQRIQYIYINRPFTEYINSFDLSTSMIWYDGALHFEPEFLKTLETNVITVSPMIEGRYNAKVNRRAQRVLDKYEDLRYEPLPVVAPEIPF